MNPNIKDLHPQIDPTALQMARQVVSEKAQIGTIEIKGERHNVLLWQKTLHHKITEMGKKFFSKLFHKIHLESFIPKQPSSPTVLSFNDPQVAKDLITIFTNELQNKRVKVKDQKIITSAIEKLKQFVNQPIETPQPPVASPAGSYASLKTKMQETLNLIDEVHGGKTESILSLAPRDIPTSLQYLSLTIREAPSIGLPEQSPTHLPGQSTPEFAFTLLRALSNPSEKEIVEELISDVQKSTQKGETIDSALQRILSNFQERLPKPILFTMLAGGQTITAPLLVNLHGICSNVQNEQLIPLGAYKGREINVDLTRRADGSIASISISQKMPIEIKKGESGECRLSSQFLIQTEILIGPDGKQEQVTHSMHCQSTSPSDKEYQWLAEYMQNIHIQVSTPSSPPT